jgi:plastocyanin
MRIRHSEARPRGLRAAAAVLAVLAAVAAVGVAGAAQEQRASATIYLSETGGPCWTTVAGKPACDPGEHPRVTIQTGETVTWDFTGTTSVHNVSSDNDSAADPGWDGWERPYHSSTGGTESRRFDAPGVYEFVCDAHKQQGMRGTITVEGEGTVTPTATATSTPIPTASPTPTPTATPDDHTTTPKPTGGPKDDVAPQLASVSTTALKRAVRVRFTVSESSKVVITAKRRGTSKVLTSATVLAPAGTSTYTLRSSRLSKGDFAIALRATDAVGNDSGATASSLKVGR